MVAQSNNLFKLIKENIKALSNQFEQEKLKDEHYLEKKIIISKYLKKKLMKDLTKKEPKEKKQNFEYLMP